MARPDKIKQKRRTTSMTIYFILSLIVPNFVLLFTEGYSLWTDIALITLPLGFYMVWSVMLRRSGIMVWLGLPFIVLGAFQIVLLYLFGDSIIATDMFTNVITTNPNEASELLANLYPAVLLVCAMYIPLLWFAALEIARKHLLRNRHRRKMAAAGGVLMAVGCLALIPAYANSEDKHVLRDEIFPINVLYNAGLSAQEFRKTMHFEETSKGFSYHAHRTENLKQREIYVFIIGEASRAASWQLFGYERETNPELSRRTDIQLYGNMMTQSNTTHKSIPTILSSVATAEHEELYRRKGLPELFREAGFRTNFISNQSPNGAMIDKLASDAHHVVYITNPRMDMQMLDEMRKQVQLHPDEDMMFILHCYGSHFSYYQRYPRDFAKFVPEDDVAVVAANVDILRNSYDNSILYTDHFINSVIEYLKSLQGVCTAMLYCADHGEDLFDDARGRFLHASPTTTYYQLHVAALSWFSEAYRKAFPQKVEAAESHSHAPATTHALFHTMADMASIEGDYVDESASLLSPAFDMSRQRFYLNDHNEAVPYMKTGLKEFDFIQFRSRNLDL